MISFFQPSIHFIIETAAFNRKSSFAIVKFFNMINFVFSSLLNLNKLVIKESTIKRLFLQNVVNVNIIV